MKKLYDYFGRVLCALLFCAGFVLSACTEEVANVPVTGVTLDTEVLELVEGETGLLNATVSPVNATNKNLLWVSSNSSIVTVSNGIVNALKPGNAKVTVKTDDGGKIATCNVVVKSRSSEDGSDNEGGNGGDDNGDGGADDAGDENKFGPATVSVAEVTATTATLKVHVDLPQLDLSFAQVSLYYSDSEPFNLNNAMVLSKAEFDSNNDFVLTLTDLKYNTKYNYAVLLKVKQEETYSNILSFTTENISISLSEASSITATTALISGTVEGLSDSDKSQIQVGMFYSAEEGKVENGQGTKLIASEIPSDNAVSFSLSELTFGTTYYYCSYVKQGSVYVYGEVKTFVTGNVSVSVSAKESTIVSEAPVAEFAGVVKGLSEEDKSDIEVGVAYYTTSEGLKTNSSTKVAVTSVISDGTFELSKQLSVDTKYHYCSYVKQNSEYVYGAEINELQTFHPYSAPSDLNVASATDLSSSASANCYIVSTAGLYKFKTVKGNSSKSIGNVASASILWETYGTSETPEYFDLIKAFCYKDGYIAFQTADTFKEGNAVIAAKDASGTILWSWHIWFTDQPKGQVYYNNAGTMMDRNLGATSATPGDVGALGLLYQWGRKDPFLGSSSIHHNSMAKAKSTITWPSAVSSDSSTGTIAYATANPTTFITDNRSDRDWYYTGSSSTDNTRWTTSESNKSIYDPCPSGWRVPDGGSNGVWSKAIGSSSDFDYTYNSTNRGMNFSGKFGSASTIWYPAPGCRGRSDGNLYNLGNCGYYWSASPDDGGAYDLSFSGGGLVFLSDDDGRADGQSVRCLQE